MSLHGHRKKYICDDCKHEAMEHFLIRNRKKRPQCPRCGSYWYDLKTKEAKADAADLLNFRQSVDRSARPTTFAPTTRRTRDRLDTP